jgi:transcriptional regulator with XRE-family HTH domain
MNLRELRKQSGQTQQECATFLGFTKQEWSRREGMSMLKMSVLTFLQSCEAVKTDPIEMLKEIQEKRNGR